MHDVLLVFFRFLIYVISSRLFLPKSAVSSKLFSAKSVVSSKFMINLMKKANVNAFTLCACCVF